jgi:hypothetical protein
MFLSTLVLEIKLKNKILISKDMFLKESQILTLYGRGKEEKNDY